VPGNINIRGGYCGANQGQHSTTLLTRPPTPLSREWKGKLLAD